MAQITPRLAPSGLAALDFIWSQYHTRSGYAACRSEDWLDEFFFCLLGGYSISFELNKSAFLTLKRKGYFEPTLPWPEERTIEEAISQQLQLPQFRVPYPEGKPRAYRFPNRKATTIAKAGRWLYEMCDFDIVALLGEDQDPKAMRGILLRCPGFGYKSASWFLRNIGKGANLAILDIHVYRTLHDLGIISTHLDIETDYLEIEEIYCCACNIIGAPPDSMDLILWEWARGSADAKCHHLP